MGNQLRQWLIGTVLELGFDVQLDSNAHAVILAIPKAGSLEDLSATTRVRVDGRDVPFEQAFSRQVFTGEHDPIAVFATAGGPLRHLPARGRISVIDDAPLIFDLAGAPIPDGLEGRFPVEWIAAGELADKPVRHAPAANIPGVERVLETAGVERVACAAGLDVGVEKPTTVVRQPDLEQQAVLAAAFLQVQEPLLLGPSRIGTEDHLHGEPFRAGERMNVDEQAILTPVELDGPAPFRFDHSWSTDDRRPLPSDGRQIIHAPFDLTGRLRVGRGPGGMGARREEQQAPPVTPDHS